MSTPSVPLFKSLNFIRGAFDQGHFVPAFRNYAIKGGNIQGTDGIVTLNAAVAIDYDVCVDAMRFSRAIVACGETDDIDLHQTAKNGNLRVTAGRFRAFVPINPEVAEFPWSEPEGKAHSVPENFIEMLGALRPFIGTDATRPWASGVLIREGKLYATNNVILVEGAMSDASWDDVRDVVIPTRAVDELLRIGATPKRLLVADGSASFLYSKTWWMKTQLITTPWPDLKALLDQTQSTGSATKLSDDFLAAFEQLKPFVQPGGAMFIKDGILCTEDNMETGAQVEGFDGITMCAFQADMMRLVLKEATHVDFSRYPQALLFIGKKVKGLLASMRSTNEGPAATKPTPETVKAVAKPPPAKKATKKAAR